MLGAASPSLAAVDAALVRQLRRTLSAQRGLPPDGDGDGDAAAAAAAATSADAAPDEPACVGTPREVRIRACAASLSSAPAAATPLRTVLASRGRAVATVEHLLAALEACGVDNARVESQGSGEVPILDGSAAPFVEAIALAGVAPARARRGGRTRARLALRLAAPVCVGDGDAFVAYVPGPVTRLSVGVDFPDEVIGRQWVTWAPGADAHFYGAVAPARTFTTRALLAAARAAGLVRGGTLRCALVADGDRWVNPPARMAQEPCRHKLLDLIGDLSLAARPGHAGLPLGHVTAYRAGHALHARFVAALTQAADAAGSAAWAVPPLPERASDAEGDREADAAAAQQQPD